VQILGSFYLEMQIASANANKSANLVDCKCKFKCKRKCKRDQMQMQSANCKCKFESKCKPDCKLSCKLQVQVVSARLRVLGTQHWTSARLRHSHSRQKHLENAKRELYIIRMEFATATNFFRINKIFILCSHGVHNYGLEYCQANRDVRKTN
jgi:hypothetical protein